MESTEGGEPVQNKQFEKSGPQNHIEKTIIEETVVNNCDCQKNKSNQALVEINRQLVENKKFLSEIQTKQAIIITMIEKCNMFNENIQKTFEGMYTEIFQIKKQISKSLNNISAGSLSKMCPEFPINTVKDFIELDKKLADKKHFDNMKSIMLDHISKVAPKINYIKEYYRTTLQVIFHEDNVKQISWKPFPQKIAIPSSHVVNLIQSIFLFTKYFKHLSLIFFFNFRVCYQIPQR